MPGIPMPGISTLWSKSTIFQSCRQGIPMPAFLVIYRTAGYLSQAQSNRTFDPLSKMRPP
jgi:hypothetical protein